MSPEQRLQQRRAERAKRLATPRTTQFLALVRATERAADDRAKATNQSATR